MAKVAKSRAQRALDVAGIAYGLHSYDYVAKGGTRASSAALGVDEHIVIKTLVFETADRKPLIVLMHGDREVSAKALARHLGVKSVAPCAPEVAERHTGFQVGGTSPFGTRKPLPVYVERTILALPRVYVNGGARGLLVDLAPKAFTEVLSATAVEAARGHTPIG